MTTVVDVSGSKVPPPPEKSAFGFLRKIIAYSTLGLLLFVAFFIIVDAFSNFYRYCRDEYFSSSPHVTSCVSNCLPKLEETKCPCGFPAKLENNANISRHGKGLVTLLEIADGFLIALALTVTGLTASKNLLNPKIKLGSGEHGSEVYMKENMLFIDSTVIGMIVLTLSFSFLAFVLSNLIGNDGKAFMVNEIQILGLTLSCVVVGLGVFLYLSHKK